MENLQPILVNALGTILSAAITTAAIMLVAYLAKLRQKAQSEINKVENESTQTYLSNVLDTVYANLSAAVDRIEVTLVKELKNATGDGKLTKEDQDRVAEAAKELCKQITGQETMDALAEIVGDTEQYLLTLIDSLVLQKKVNGADLNAAQAIDAKNNLLNS